MRRLFFVALVSLMGLVSLMASTALAASSVEAPVILLSNFGRVLIGQKAAVEGGAFAARANDPSASWYNPAGLTRATKDTLSATVSLYEASWISLKSAKTSEGSMRITDFPSFVGKVWILSKEEDRTTLAWSVSVVKPIVWSQSQDFGERTEAEGWVQDYVGSYALELSALAPGVALGWAPSPRFRVGAGARLYVMNLAVKDSAFIRDVNHAEGIADTLLMNSSLSSTIYALRANVGVQYQPSERVHLGLHLRSPTAAIYNTGQVNEQLVWGGNGHFEDALRIDDELPTEVRLPLEIDVAAALEHPTWAVEVDLRFHLPISRYSVAKSSAKGSRASWDEVGMSVDEITGEVEATAETALIVNGALGGRLAITDTEVLHFGAFTALSPVADDREASELFTKLDLYGASLGLSMEGEHADTTLGFVLMHGREDGWSLNGRNAELWVTTLGVVLGGAYWY